MSYPLYITIIHGKFNREKQAMRKEMHIFSLSSICHSKNAIFYIAHIVEKVLIFYFYLMICKVNCHHRINVIWKGRGNHASSARL